MVFAGVGLVLGRPEKDAPLVITRPATLDQVAPPAFGYDADPPAVERVHPYDDFSGGLGAKIQNGDGPDNRYYYGLGFDGSAGIGQKGPAVTQLTPAITDATNGISDFFEIGGRFYALAGRYCLYRQDDTTWPVSKDFGVGKAGLTALAFYSNGAGANYAYVAMGDAELLWRTDGATATTTWTQHGTLYARAFAIAGRDFYRANATNVLAKVSTDTDPWVAGNWTIANSFSIGDKSTAINRLVTTVTGVVIAFKNDGIYSLQGEGDPNPGFDVNLYPYLRQAPLADNGKFIGTWQNDIYVGYGYAGFRIKPTVSFGTTQLPIEEIGVERVVDNDSVVHGQPTASFGHEDFCLYQGIYNPDTGNSYLLKFGGWGLDPATQQPRRLEVWHGSITTAFVGKKITAMAASTIGAPSNHKRLYLGFSDGSVAWFTLPCAPNPMACSSYPYTSSDASVYHPQFDANFRNDAKVCKAITVSGLNLSTADSVQVQVATDPTSAPATILDSAGAPISFNQSPRQKVWLPSGTVGTIFKFVTILKSSDGTSSYLTSMAVHTAVRSAPVLAYGFNVLTDRYLVKRDGAPYWRPAEDIQALLRNSLAATGPTTITLPDESTKDLAVIGYQESQAWSERTRKWHGAIHVDAIDFTSTQTLQLGTLNRLAGYTLAQLATNTLSQLVTL